MKKIFVLFLIIFNCSCAPIYVSYDFEKSTDFSIYKTYNYYADLETGLNQLESKRLIKVLDSQMQAKGFSLSESPDFYVNVVVIEYDNAGRNTFGLGFGGVGDNTGGGISIGLPIGQLKTTRRIIFEFIGQGVIGLFWQAVSESNFNHNVLPEKRETQFYAITGKVLKSFPPKL